MRWRSSRGAYSALQFHSPTPHPAGGEERMRKELRSYAPLSQILGHGLEVQRPM